jgi:hypothetical protein
MLSAQLRGHKHRVEFGYTSWGASTTAAQPRLGVYRSEADPRAGCADHFGRHLPTDLGDYRLGYAFLAKTGEQQKDPGQPFFA